MPQMNLDDIKQKSHPYQVPEGYFEELNRSILERTSAVPQESEVLWYRLPVWQLAVASVSLIVVLSVLLFSGVSSAHDVLSDVSDEEILIYLANNDLTTTEILENFTFTEEDLFLQEEELLDDIEIDDSMLDDLYLDYEVDDQPLKYEN